MRSKKEVMTLCAVCHSQFRDNSSRRIYRTKKKTRDTCMFCNTRMGFDYVIKDKRGER